LPVQRRGARELIIVEGGGAAGEEPVGQPGEVRRGRREAARLGSG